MCHTFLVSTFEICNVLIVRGVAWRGENGTTYADEDIGTEGGGVGSLSEESEQTESAVHMLSPSFL
jgi:hypothetical protein